MEKNTAFTTFFFLMVLLYIFLTLLTVPVVSYKWDSQYLNKLGVGYFPPKRDFLQAAATGRRVRDWSMFLIRSNAHIIIICITWRKEEKELNFEYVLGLWISVWSGARNPESGLSRVMALAGL